MIYTVTFNPALDYILKVNSFKTGITNRSFSEEIQIGGKGINVSVILNRLGCDNIAFGFVAGFTGDELQRRAEKIGIKTDFIKLSKGDTRINVKLKADNETEINAQGPEIGESDLKGFFSKLSSLKKGDTLVLSGSVPKSLPSDIYEKILKDLVGKNIRFCIDTAGELLLNTLKYKPYIIKPNNFELEEIFGDRLETEEKIIAAQKLKEMGAQNVLVSLGNQGAVLVDEFGNIHKTSAHKITPTNTVGAGDSMLAGFLAGVQNGYPYALMLGNAAGAATASAQGLAEKSDIEFYLKSALR